MRVVFISGSSSGIGRAAALLLYQQGYSVYGGSRQPDAGLPFPMLQLDVTDAESVNAAVATVLQQAGRIDILINNAGIALGGAVEEGTVDDARRLFETNLFGVIRLTNAILPHMRQQRRGHIINISSLAGIIGVPYLGLYAASKHALEGYSESLRYELAHLNIAISLIEPGDIRTGIVNQPPSQMIAEYANICARTEKIHIHNVQQGPPPDVVARVILRALRENRPRLRYPVTQGSEGWVPWMKRLLPDRWIEWLVRRNYRLDE